MSAARQGATRLDDADRLTLAVPRASHAFTGWPTLNDAVVTARQPATPRRHVALDVQRLQHEGVLVATATRNTLAEEFRRVKRPLVDNARAADAAARRLPLIVVTSAQRGEGRSFCALNLACSIGLEIDMRVLLVDADFAHPDLAARLGIEAEAGLLDVLKDPARPLSDVVLETNLPGLSLLQAGSPDPLSAEWLASPAMNRLLARLAGGEEGIVVFDAPPLLNSSEALVLASQVGQVLLVVEAGRTPEAAVRRACDALSSRPGVFCVLNKTSAAAPASRVRRFAGPA